LSTEILIETRDGHNKTGDLTGCLNNLKDLAQFPCDFALDTGSSMAYIPPTIAVTRAWPHSEMPLAKLTETSGTGWSSRPSSRWCLPDPWRNPLTK